MTEEKVVEKEVVVEDKKPEVALIDMDLYEGIPAKMTQEHAKKYIEIRKGQKASAKEVEALNSKLQSFESEVKRVKDENLLLKAAKELNLEAIESQVSAKHLDK